MKMEKERMRKYAFRENLTLLILGTILSYFTASTTSELILNSESTFVATGISNGLTITNNFTGEENTVCEVDAEDDDIFSSDVQITGDQEVSVSFLDYGYKNITQTCLGEDNFISTSKLGLYVGDTISGVDVTNGSTGTEIQVLLPLTDDVKFSVIFEFGTNVTIDIENLANGKSYGIIDAVNGSANDFTFPISDFPENGLYTQEVVLSNPLINITKYVVFAVQNPITTPVIRLRDYPDSGDQTTHVLVTNDFVIEFETLMAEDVTYTLTVEASNGGTLVDIIGDTCIGIYEEQYVHTLSYIFPDTTSYLVILEMSNFVSNFNKSYEIFPIHKVNSFELDVNQDIALYTTQIDFTLAIIESTLNLQMGDVKCDFDYDDTTTDSEENIDFKFSTFVELPEGSKTFTKSHSYQVASWYNVEITCSNNLPEVVDTTDTTQVLSKQIVIINPVENLEMDHDAANLSHFPFSEELCLTIITLQSPSNRPLHNITCSYKYSNGGDIEVIGDPVSGNVTNSSNTTLCFQISPGDDSYNVEVNCSNELTYQVLTLPQQVTVFYDCWKEPPAFFDDSFKLAATAQTSQTHIEKKISANVELTSNCEPPITTVWKVIDIDNNIAIQTEGSESQTTKTFRNNTMDPGHYNVCLKMIYEFYESNPYFEDCMFLNFTLPNLVADFHVNNKEATSILQVSLHEELTLSTSSHDPAAGLPSVDNTLSSLKWSCVKGISFTQSDIDNYFPDLIMIENGEVCDSDFPDIYADTVTIPAETLQENVWYIITITYSHGNRLANASKALYPLSRTPLKCILDCVTNCDDKLGLKDFGLDLVILTPGVNVNEAVITWTVETRNTQYDPYVDVTGSLVSSSGYGFTITADQFAILNSTIYKITANIIVSSGFPESTISDFYPMNQAPYNGVCSFHPDNPSPAVAGIDDVCITCSGWIDEGSNQYRDASIDTSGGLVYRATQVFLTSTGDEDESVDRSVLDEKDSGNMCVKLIYPRNGVKTVQVRLEIRDLYSKPPAEVIIGNIELEPPIPEDASVESGAEAVVDFLSANTAYIESATTLNDPALMGIVATNVITNLPEVPQIETVMPPPDEVPADQLPDFVDGKPVSPDRAIDGLKKPTPDPFTIVLQNATSEMFGAFKNAMDSAAESLEESTPEENIRLASSFQNMLQVPPANLNNDAKQKALVIMSSIFAMAENNEAEDSPWKEELETVTLGAASQLLSLLVPDVAHTLKTESEARQEQMIKQYFLSPESKVLMENDALMSRGEIAFLDLKNNMKNLIEVEQHLENARTFSNNLDAANKNIIKQTTPSHGSTKIIGTADIKIAVVRDSTVNLAERSIKAEMTTIQFPGIRNLPDSDAKISVVEMKKVSKVDDNSDHTKLSDQIQFSLDTDQELSKSDERIILTQKVPPVQEDTLLASTDPGDASGFVYALMGCEANKDVVIRTNPVSSDIGSIDVYVYAPRSGGNKHVSIVNYGATAPALPDNEHVVKFTPEEHECSTGYVEVGIRVTLDEATTEARRRRAVDDDGHVPSFNFSATTMACMTFDDSTNTWRSDECSGTWSPTTGDLDCYCKPKKELTVAKAFYVAPNTIDFSTVFLKFSPLNQAAVMSVLILILIIYIIIVIWARRQDRKDILKWGITPLSDNFCEDNYFYVIKVFTGMRPGAGTRSRISMVIAGDEMDTGVRELSDGVREEFVTGSVMNFLMSTSGYLGDLDYTRIWHDNSGGGNSASWYLSKLEIHDIQRNESFVFLAERWLAVEKEDCLLECVLPVCKTENLNKFRNRFFMNAKDNLAESHIWVSVAYRPQVSNFTRVQRASCALLFVMLTMIANAMFFKTSDEGNYETPSELQVGPFRFSLRQVYTSVISALIVTPPTIVVIYLFKLTKTNIQAQEKIFNQRHRKGRYKVPFMSNWLDEERKRSMELEKHLVTKGIPANSSLKFPYWVAYIAWLLLVAGSFLSAFFVMLFSMEWGKQKSEEWVTTFLLSFIESVFCLDPIKVGIMALVFALIFRSTQDSDTPVDRSTIMRNYSSGLRGQSGGTRLPAPPMDGKKLEKARSLRQRELLMKTAFRDVITNIIIIWILFSISYSNTDTRSYDMLQEITNNLMDPVNLPKFTKIQSINEYFDWLNNTAIQNMFPEKEIDGNQTALHWRLRQFIQGGTLFRVGPPRLRQVRTTKKTCHNPYFESQDCFKKYTEPSEDTDSYCLSWKSGVCSDDERLYSFSSAAWKFTSALDIWGLPISGYYTTYSGGGYIAKLDVNRKVSTYILNELYENSWVDRQTRAVMYEYTLYCLNANVFAYSMFVVEFPETGGAFPYFNIFPLKIYQHLGTLGMYTLLCEVIFVLYQVICTVSIIVMLVQQKKAFFKKGWQVYDFLFTILGYVAIIMYAIRYAFVQMSLDVFRKDKGDFINFYHIALWNQSLVLLIGILVFMATLRMLNILGYNKRIGALARVFTEAANELVWFGIFFLYVFTCYSAFGFLLFGSKLKSYMNVFKAMGTLFISMIGKSRFTEIDNTDPVMSKIYFIIFIFFVVYMILTMFLAILSKAIDEVHADTKVNKSDEMVDYVIKKVTGLLSYGSRSRNPSVKPTHVRLTSAAPNKRKLDASGVTKMDHREILQEIRKSMNEALTSNPRDFTTPSDERREKKVTFRR